MSDSDDREGATGGDVVAHLQAAGRELIAAARAVLDTAEDVIGDRYRFMALLATAAARRPHENAVPEPAERAGPEAVTEAAVPEPADLAGPEPAEKAVPEGG